MSRVRLGDPSFSWNTANAEQPVEQANDSRHARFVDEHDADADADADANGDAGAGGEAGCRGDGGVQRLLTRLEVASVFQVCPETVSNWVRRGELNAIRIGRSLRFRTRDLEKMITPSQE